MLLNQRKAMSVILSKVGKDGRHSEASVAPESGEHNEYTSCAEDLLSALKDGSVQRVASVLRSFHELVKEEDEVQDQEG